MSEMSADRPDRLFMTVVVAEKRICPVGMLDTNIFHLRGFLFRARPLRPHSVHRIGGILVCRRAAEAGKGRAIQPWSTGVEIREARKPNGQAFGPCLTNRGSSIYYSAWEGGIKLEESVEGEGEFWDWAAQWQDRNHRKSEWGPKIIQFVSSRGRWVSRRWNLAGGRCIIETRTKQEEKARETRI